MARKRKADDEGAPRTYACDTCDYVTNRHYSWTMHMRTHTNERAHKCTWNGCEYAATQSGHLTAHMLTHTGKKPFLCTWEGCKYATTQNSALRTHMRSHTHEKPYTCTWDGCEYAASESGTLTKHLRVHTNQRPFMCTIHGCGYAAKTAGVLQTHLRTHTNERPFVCTVEACGYAAKQRGHLQKHVRAHTGHKPYACSFEGCNYAATTSSSLKTHTKAMHTAEGQQRQKKKENKVLTYLQQWWTVEREVQVSFSCFASDGKFARLDGVIHFPERELTVVVEVDEDQHVHYMPGCDTRRMMDVTTALMCSGTATPNLLWVRYNPDAFSVDAKHVKYKSVDRLQRLKQVIESYQPVVDTPVAVQYMFYDVVDGELALHADAEYHREVKQLCLLPVY